MSEEKWSAKPAKELKPAEEEEKKTIEPAESKVASPKSAVVTKAEEVEEASVVEGGDHDHDDCCCDHDHDHDEHDHDSCGHSDCSHDHELHVHESDPNDPVTALCAQINKDLDSWESSGTMTSEKLNAALDRFDEALKLTSKHMDALLGKAYVQGELGQSEEAVVTLLQAMAIDDKDVRVHTMLGQLGEFDDSLLDNPDMPDLDIVEKFMNQKGEPTKKFEIALTEIFERYADGEGKFRAITKKGMDRFHHFVNGGPLSESAMDYLFSGEWELNPQGNITLQGFISFYLNQTFADPQETISDLKKLGYDNELNPTSAKAPTQAAAPTERSAAPSSSAPTA